MFWKMSGLGILPTTMILMNTKRPPDRKAGLGNTMRVVRPLMVAVLIATLLALVAACGGSDVSPETSQDTSTPSSSRESDITNFIFENLTISVGTTVTWTNQDRDTHTSTSGEGSKFDGVWDSKFLEQGEQFSTTFSQPGVSPYWCRLHPRMRATVTVEVQQ